MTDAFAAAYRNRFPERGPVLEALERMASAPLEFEAIIDPKHPNAPTWREWRLVDWTHPGD